jgi:hypothetical protein
MDDERRVGPAGNADLNARIDYPSSDQWRFYADGYKLCADVAIGHVRDTGEDKNLLVFPIVFNYRQYLELSIKDLILQAQANDDTAKMELTATHDLMRLWMQLRPHIRRFGWDDETLEGAEHLLREFARVDSTSYVFRYPASADYWTPSDKPRVKQVDLGRLQERIAEVARIFEIASGGWRHSLDNRFRGVPGHS